MKVPEHREGSGPYRRPPRSHPVAALWTPLLSPTPQSEPTRSRISFRSGNVCYSNIYYFILNTIFTTQMRDYHSRGPCVRQRAISSPPTILSSCRCLDATSFTSAAIWCRHPPRQHRGKFIDYKASMITGEGTTASALGRTY